MLTESKGKKRILELIKEHVVFVQGPTSMYIGHISLMSNANNTANGVLAYL